MTTNDFFAAIAGISGLLIMLTSMLAMSLSLSVPQMTHSPGVADHWLPTMFNRCGCLFPF